MIQSSYARMNVCVFKFICTFLNKHNLLGIGVALLQDLGGDNANDLAVGAYCDDDRGSTAAGDVKQRNLRATHIPTVLLDEAASTGKWGVLFLDAMSLLTKIQCVFSMHISMCRFW